MPTDARPGTMARSGRVTVLLCFLVALIEGFELQAAGMAAPGLGPAMSLSPSQLSWFFAASTVGMLLGAYSGGVISDRRGRKFVLLVSVVAFGLFTLLTGLATSYAWLVAARFLTGVGLGGALPMIIALAAENNPAKSARSVALTYSGTPLGGALAGAVYANSTDWQIIFFVGAALPLLVAPLIAIFMPDSRPQAHAAASTSQKANTSATDALFADGRLPLTLVLWVSFFLGLLLLYLMMNWTPMLLDMRGFSRPQIAAFQIVLNVSGALCCMFGGRWLDGPYRAHVAAAAFLAIAVFLYLIGQIPPQLAYILPIAVGFGAGLLLSQSVLYALSSALYPPMHRGAGIGAAVSMGRAGSVAGPLVGGAMLSFGLAPPMLLVALIPGVVISGGGVLYLMARTERSA